MGMAIDNDTMVIIEAALETGDHQILGEVLETEIKTSNGSRRKRLLCIREELIDRPARQMRTYLST